MKFFGYIDDFINWQFSSLYIAIPMLILEVGIIIVILSKLRTVVL